MAGIAVSAAIGVLSTQLGGRHPASDGAHRLGWWLAAQADPVEAAERVARASCTSPAWLERVLSGDVEPEYIEAEAIAIATRHAVAPIDWQRGGPLRWEERPLERKAP